MKVIFLDIDGVLNNKETMQRHRGFIGIDPYLVAIFNRIILATDAKIVLSSTWRLEKVFQDEVRKQVWDFIDITPRLPNEKRGTEVKVWLDKHPEVERYAILDDDRDFLEGQPLFKTTWDEGLTEEIAKQVIEYLNSYEKHEEKDTK